jgi:hypothetical protein
MTRGRRKARRRSLRLASLIVSSLLIIAAFFYWTGRTANPSASPLSSHVADHRSPAATGSATPEATSAGVASTRASSAQSAPLTAATTATGKCRWCSYFAGFRNGLPSSRGFFPIAVWSQYGGSIQKSGPWGFPRQYRDLAAAAAGAGINTFIGEYGWPDAYGRDADPSGPGFLQAACNVGDYVIAGGDPSSNRTAGSVASVDKIARREKRRGTNISCSHYLAGYMIGDEPPECTTNVRAQVAAIHAEDPTRLVIEGMAGGWVTWNQSGCPGKADAAFSAPSLPASDDYHNVDPWNVNSCEAASHVSRRPVADCSWVYGYAEAIENKLGRGKPTEAIIETGNDAFGFAEQNGSRCDKATNRCSDGNEYNATAPQVNSDVWGALINGAAAIEYFCDGNARTGAFGYSDCLGGSGKASAAIFSNLQYIDHIIATFAPELNTVSNGACTMQPSTYSSRNEALRRSCSGGDLKVSTSSAIEPIQAMAKSYDGSEYLFVMADRANGSTIGTYTVAGHAGQTAKLIYDSAARYDPGKSELGRTFVLNGSSQFSDSLTGDNGRGSNGYGTGANSYEVKIYKIS